jgi:cyclase
MAVPRIIARLDIKAPNLIKGVHLEGLRVIGDPAEYALKYYQQGADELIYTDIVASLYERNSLIDLIKTSTQNIFIPITIGGGLRTVSDVEAALRAGADKVAINTAAVKRPEFVQEVANKFGSQCMVLGVEAMSTSKGKWEVYYDNGREKTGIDVKEWCIDSVARGAGEILLTSIDQEGTCKGFDLDLIKTISTCVNVPVIASGGAGSLDDIENVLVSGCADAVAIAHLLHYNKTTVTEIKTKLSNSNISVRV